MPDAGADAIFEIALLTDVVTNRDGNEDSCGHLVESAETVLLGFDSSAT